jgi:hypothetical protein
MIRYTVRLRDGRLSTSRRRRRPTTSAKEVGGQRVPFSIDMIPPELRERIGLSTQPKETDHGR